MSRPTTIIAPVKFTRAAHGRRRLGSADQAQPPARAPGRVPRVARLMALAIRLDAQVRSGALASYSELAEMGHVSRARVSQIKNLVNLAPDVQEAILFLPRTERGRDPIHLRLVQPIASAIDWKKQRRLWHELLWRGGRQLRVEDVISGPACVPSLVTPRRSMGPTRATLRGPGGS